MEATTNTPATPPKKLASTDKEAATRLSVSIKTVERRMRDQRIEYCRIGTSVRFTGQQLRDYLETVAIQRPQRKLPIVRKSAEPERKLQ